MRRAFIKILMELAEKDERIVFLIGDIGFRVFEDFVKKFPNRFINCGVAEQNMMGVAAGLALSGKKPYVYSIVPFVTLRCLEQIRNDVCYQNLDVKIIGVGGGFSYGELGATHSVTEDLAILRSLPNMNVFSPSDLLSTEKIMNLSYNSKSPTYIRLTNNGDVKVYDKSPNLEIGKPNVVKDGRDIAIVATGVQVSYCKKAIEKSGKNIKLIDFHTIKPIDKEDFLSKIANIREIYTFEEHNVIGGLGGAVAEILAESTWQAKFRIIGVSDEYPSEIGKAEYLRDKYLIGQNEIEKFISKI